MSIPLPRDLVERVLLGPEGDRRQLQDSPVLGDVWIAFAAEPAQPQEILITPYKEHSASGVAQALDELVANARERHPHSEGADVAYLQGLVAAKLHFTEVLLSVVPLTGWWRNSKERSDNTLFKAHGRRDYIRDRIEVTRQILNPSSMRVAARAEIQITALDRFIFLAGIILWARDARPGRKRLAAIDWDKTIDFGRVSDAIARIFDEIPEQYFASRQTSPAMIYQVSLNRPVSMALAKSVAAVKADAARNLFKVECNKIAWAVIDSGIQGDHPAFMKDGVSRVKAAFDFSNYRRVVSLDNRRIFGEFGRPADRQKRLGELIGGTNLKNPPTADQAKEWLRQLSEDLVNKRPLHLDFVRPFVEVNIETPPVNDHGTHVAGIIGADSVGASTSEGDGVCPDIQLYDFRVLSDDPFNTEFSVIAALQFIRYLNDRNEYITIHGANLSLSIPHDVRNYACGRTPVCVECERLVDSGVVVVAAAGNRGYQSFTTKEGNYDSYAAFSVTDPGNADGVLTVGSTHRSSPHTYGVSFFSSRGPTGDGRAKPDLVAPGERIRAPFRAGYGDLDGTSMAAPHVSGAAAMLLARYGELIGRPRRIKEILCESATDLGRERSFQGNGMLDVLRAFQKL